MKVRPRETSRAEIKRFYKGTRACIDKRNMAKSEQYMNTEVRGWNIEACKGLDKEKIKAK
jgi:hypothetical protein